MNTFPFVSDTVINIEPFERFETPSFGASNTRRGRGGDVVAYRRGRSKENQRSFDLIRVPTPDTSPKEKNLLSKFCQHFSLASPRRRWPYDRNSANRSVVAASSNLVNDLNPRPLQSDSG
ncbi:hypothetical protein EVAR_6145_1 [Eumeta japonica]|uniref:Uncharacterized protein n=1 Tax=Eumeta variegata TaxID=151549 RepID=A0A4C1TEA2_EUMVA|nr:hypothetical protein EVAR_6145_1 [Eumeta japonica]